MEREGYVRQDHNTERFSLGLKILGLAEGLLANMDVREHALEGMQELMAETQETVHLGVLLGLDVMCIESVVSDRRNAIGSMAGKRTQVHVSSMGKVILAFSPETTVSEALQVRGLPRLTPSTITEEDEFLQALAAIRETGYAVSDEEEEVGIRCVAAPIWDHRHHPIAALSVAAPAARLEGKTLAEIAELLVRHSNRITVSLGG
jgi:IclR family acetate operon transcriptional repressor